MTLIDVLRPGTYYLSAIAGGIGIAALLVSITAFLLPDGCLAFYRRFPRSVWPGRILTVLCFVWAACWLYVMPLGPVSFLQSLLPYLTPVAIVAVWFCLGDLLSCRAVGGLMVLLPTPMLSAAQWHPSGWRYAVIVLAYAMAIFGMFVVAMPYLLRDLMTWCTRSKPRFLRLVFLELGLGLLLFVLALTVFRG